MTKKHLSVALLAIVLLSFAPSAFADDGVKGEHSNSFGTELKERFGLWKHQEKHDDAKDHDEKDNKRESATLVGTVTQIQGSTLTLKAKNNVTYSVTFDNATMRGGAVSDISVDDHIVAWGSLTNETLTAKRIANVTELQLTHGLKSNALVGVVTSIGTSSFTIDPVGAEATTTVEFTSDTEFMKKHKETSLSSLLLGSHVLIKGTTTAESSTEGDTFVAELVKIFEKGFGNLKFWFWAK